MLLELRDDVTVRVEFTGMVTHTAQAYYDAIREIQEAVQYVAMDQRLQIFTLDCDDFFQALDAVLVRL